MTKALICALTLVATATTSSADEPAGKIRNILLIMSDDLKASVLPPYGDAVCRTPNIDSLAKSGIVFERAYCQGLACSPSRPSMMRSIYPKSKKTAPTIGGTPAAARDAHRSRGQDLSYARASRAA